MYDVYIEENPPTMKLHWHTQYIVSQFYFSLSLYCYLFSIYCMHLSIEKVGMEVKGDKLEKRLVKLKCSVQNYNWGRIGYDSRVARLFERNCGGQSQIEENKHYAEFWIGTHVSGPSFLETDHNVSLKSWILQNPKKLLGDVVHGDLISLSY